MDETFFFQHLHDLTLILETHSVHFKNYFVKYYIEGEKYKCWSSVFRKNTLNTNNHLESFHKQLKHKYMQTKFRVRLDTFIKILDEIVLEKF